MNKFNWLDKNKEVLHDKYEWFAVSGDGFGYAFIEKPVIINNKWVDSNHTYIRVNVNSNIDWKLSLLERNVEIKNTKVNYTPFNWLKENGEPYSLANNWFAVDSDGTGFIFLDKPDLNANKWYDGNFRLCVGKYDAVNYKLSLQKRIKMNKKLKVVSNHRFNWLKANNEPYSLAYTWFAVDGNNNGYIFPEKPVLSDGKWIANPKGSIFLDRPIFVNSCNDNDHKFLLFKRGIETIEYVEDEYTEELYTEDQIVSYFEFLHETFKSKNLDMDSEKMLTSFQKFCAKQKSKILNAKVLLENSGFIVSKK